MNYYFLLEDEKSFIKVLPEWLKHLNFTCKRVPDIKFVEDKNYVLQSGQGVTQLITKVLFETIDTINENPKTIDKLVIILDAEEETVEERKQQVFSKIINMMSAIWISKLRYLYVIIALKVGCLDVNGYIHRMRWKVNLFSILFIAIMMFQSVILRLCQYQETVKKQQRSITFTIYMKC
ncbi:MAG: hypothetical protein HFI05_13210 [Lachnospiraceae bacterium]|jgi:hypothetical protein|nr:hypothetical protein [Lachnospiraceae bacterium]